jgi:hypothetical protein
MVVLLAGTGSSDQFWKVSGRAADMLEDIMPSHVYSPFSQERVAAPSHTMLSILKVTALVQKTIV